MSDIHKQVVDLLPWFSNGSLPAAERRMVEEHVSGCVPCRRALVEERSIGSLVRRLDVPQAQANGLNRLLRAVDESNRAGRRRAGFLPGRWPARLPRLLVASAATLTLLVAGWLAIEGLNAPPAAMGGEFTTLSNSATPAIRTLDVVFTEDTAGADIADVFAGIDAAVIGGPTEIGRYVVRIPDDVEAAIVLDRLQRDPRVAFAGISYAPAEAQ